MPAFLTASARFRLGESGRRKRKKQTTSGTNDLMTFWLNDFVTSTVHDTPIAIEAHQRGLFRISLNSHHLSVSQSLSLPVSQSPSLPVTQSYQTGFHFCLDTKTK